MSPETVTFPVKVEGVVCGYATLNGGPELAINITNREVRGSLKELLILGLADSINIEPVYIPGVADNNMKENI